MPFTTVELVKQFEPRAANAVYGMDKLLALKDFPRARAITIIAIADSSVNGSPLTIQPVGSDGPDPNDGLLHIGEPEPMHDTTTPLRYTKLAHTIEIVKAAFPYYGVVFHTGPTPPTAGFCWAYALVWMED